MTQSSSTLTASTHTGSTHTGSTHTGSTHTNPARPASVPEPVAASRPSRFAAQLGLAIVALTLVVCFGILAGATRGMFP
jgi:hypothetical protein